MKRVLTTLVVLFIKSTKGREIINKTLVIQKNQPRFISVKELLDGREFEEKLTLKQQKNSFLDLREKGKITKKNTFQLNIEDEKSNFYIKNFKIFKHLNINQKEIGVIELKNAVIFYSLEDDKATEILRVRLEDLGTLTLSIKREIITSCYTNYGDKIYLVIEVRETYENGKELSLLHNLIIKENKEEKKYVVHYSGKFKTTLNSRIKLYSSKDDTLLEECDAKCSLIDYIDEFRRRNDYIDNYFEILFARFCFIDDKILSKKYPPGTTKSIVEIFSYQHNSSMAVRFYTIDNYEVSLFESEKRWEKPEVLGIYNFFNKTLIFDRKGILLRNKLLNRKTNKDFRIAYNSMEGIEKYRCQHINKEELVCSIYTKDNRKGEIINFELLKHQNSIIYLNPKHYKIDADEILAVINYQSFILAYCNLGNTQIMRLINKKLNKEVENFEIPDNYETLKMRNYQIGLQGDIYLEGHAAVLVRDKNAENTYKILIFQISQPYFKLIPIESSLSVSECEYFIRNCSKSEFNLTLNDSKENFGTIKVYIIDSDYFSSILKLNNTEVLDPNFFQEEYLVPLSKSYFGGIKNLEILNYRRVGLDKGKGVSNYHHYEHSISEDYMVRFIDDFGDERFDFLNYQAYLGGQKFYLNHLNEKTDAFFVLYVKPFTHDLELIFKDFKQVIPEGNSDLSSKSLLTHLVVKKMQIWQFYFLGRFETHPTCLFFMNRKRVISKDSLALSRFCFEEKEYKFFGGEINNPKYDIKDIVDYSFIHIKGGKDSSFLVTVLKDKLIFQRISLHKTEPVFDVANFSESYSIGIDHLVDLESLKEFGYQTYKILDFKFWPKDKFVVKIGFYKNNAKLINFFGFYTVEEDSLSISKIGSILRKQNKRKEVLYLSDICSKAALISAYIEVEILVYDLEVEILRKSTPALENSFKPVMDYQRKYHLSGNETIYNTHIPGSLGIKHIYLATSGSFSLFITTRDVTSFIMSNYTFIFRFNKNSIMEVTKIIKFDGNLKGNLNNDLIDTFDYYEFGDKESKRNKLIYSLVEKDDKKKILLKFLNFWTENHLIMSGNDKKSVELEMSQSKEIKIPIRITDIEGVHYEEYYRISPKKGYEIFLPEKMIINEMEGILDLKFNKKITEGGVISSIELQCSKNSSKFKIEKNRIKSIICGNKNNEFIINSFMQHFYNLDQDEGEIEYKHGRSFIINKKSYIMILTDKYLTFIRVNGKKLREVLRIENFEAEGYTQRKTAFIPLDQCNKIIHLDNDLRKFNEFLEFEIMCLNEASTVSVLSKIPVRYLEYSEELCEVLVVNYLKTEFRNVPDYIVSSFYENKEHSKLFVFHNFYFTLNTQTFKGTEEKTFFNIHKKNLYNNNFTFLFTSLDDKYSKENVEDYLVLNYTSIENKYIHTDFEFEFLLLKRDLSTGILRVDLLKVIFRLLISNGDIMITHKDLISSASYSSPKSNRIIFNTKLDDIKLYDNCESSLKEYSVLIKKDENGNKVLDIKLQRIFSKKGLCVVKKYFKITSSEKLIIYTCFSSLDTISENRMIFYEISERKDRDEKPDYYNPVFVKRLEFSIPRVSFLIKIIQTEEDEVFLLIPCFGSIISIYRINLNDYSIEQKKGKIDFLKGSSNKIEMTLRNRYHTKVVELNFEDPLSNNAQKLFRWLNGQMPLVTVITVYFFVLFAAMFSKNIADFIKFLDRKSFFKIFRKEKKRKLIVFGEYDYQSFVNFSIAQRNAVYD